MLLLILFVVSVTSCATQTIAAGLPTAPNSTSPTKLDVMAILETRVLSEIDLHGMPTQPFLDKLYEVFRMESNVTFVLTIKSITEV